MICWKKGQIQQHLYQQHNYGINNRSLLNKLEYFHVCNFGLPPDVMHDLLEGYVPYIMKLLLNQIINKEKLFTLDYLNNLILYFNYGTNEARNKPNCLTTKELASEDHGLNQSGMLKFACFYFFFVSLLVLL